MTQEKHCIRRVFLPIVCKKIEWHAWTKAESAFYASLFCAAVQNGISQAESKYLTSLRFRVSRKLDVIQEQERFDGHIMAQLGKLKMMYCYMLLILIIVPRYNCLQTEWNSCSLQRHHIMVWHHPLYLLWQQVFNCLNPLLTVYNHTDTHVPTNGEGTAIYYVHG